MPQIPTIPTPGILVFAGSARVDAYSGRTADIAGKTLAVQGAEVTRISLADYPLPIMDEDLEREQAFPRTRAAGPPDRRHDGASSSRPNIGSIPPLLKNAIDWVSRVRRDGGHAFAPMAGKPVALCSSRPAISPASAPSLICARAGALPH